MINDLIDYDDFDDFAVGEIMDEEQPIKFVDIDIEVKEERNACLCVKTRKAAEVWLPISKVVVENVQGSIYTLIMPSWFAESKGLI
jgi:hypothetical protein